MKLTVSNLPIGSHTADDRLLEQLEELSLKLDEECDSLLPDASNSNNEDVDLPIRKEPFGVIYAKDLDFDKAVAYLKYVPMTSVCRIESLYVDKEYRRKCIGYSLMREFYNICLKSKFAKINLGCIAANEGGIAFYKSEGYKISDASYILCRQKDLPNRSSLKLKERAFNEDDYNRIWNEMQSYLDKGINLTEELEMLRSYYLDTFKPLSICSFDGFECAVFAHEGDSELYVVASNVNPSILNEELLDGIAMSFLQYAKKKKLQQACVTDIHLPATLGKISSCWKEVGYTFYKMASDLHPKKSNLRC